MPDIDILTELPSPAAPLAEAPTGAVLAMLGNIAFAATAASFERMQRTATQRWQAQPRIGRRPAWQHTGPGRETLILEGVVFPAFRAGPAAIQRLDELARRAEPQRLVDGAGGVHGLWVLTRIEETRTGMFSNGAARKIAWRIELQRYGDDAPQGAITTTPSDERDER